MLSVSNMSSRVSLHEVVHHLLHGLLLDIVFINLHIVVRTCSLLRFAGLGQFRVGLFLSIELLEQDETGYKFRG